MSEAIIYNQLGEKVGTKQLIASVFDIPGKEAVVHQVMVAQMANRRKVIAHTKGRAEVRGGGKKPWRQKGTGRARHGSSRSPIWIGGGITFGPNRWQNFTLKVNKKMKQLALKMLLSNKVQHQHLFLLDKLELKDQKTKVAVKMLDSLPSAGKKVCLALDKDISAWVKVLRNVSGVRVVDAQAINVLDLLQFSYFVTTEAGLDQIVDRFVKKEVVSVDKPVT